VVVEVVCTQEILDNLVVLEAEEIILADSEQEILQVHHHHKEITEQVGLLMLEEEVELVQLVAQAKEEVLAETVELGVFILQLVLTTQVVAVDLLQIQTLVELVELVEEELVQIIIIMQLLVRLTQGAAEVEPKEIKVQLEVVVEKEFVF
jgi:hypothetical protein